MKLAHFLTTLILVLGSFSASAIDTTMCPEQVVLSVQVERVVKNSIYEETPGWKDAQQALLKNASTEIFFNLLKKEYGRCSYQDESNQTATLRTTSFADPESQEPNRQDQFVANFRLNESGFVTYIPIKTVNLSGLRLYDSPFKLKIKSRLYSPDKKRELDFDMGLISVVVK